MTDRRREVENRVSQMAIDMFFGEDAAEALENASQTEPQRLRDIFMNNRAQRQEMIDTALRIGNRTEGLDRMARMHEQSAAYNQLDMMRAREGLEAQGEPIHLPTDESNR